MLPVVAHVRGPHDRGVSDREDAEPSAPDEASEPGGRGVETEAGDGSGPGVSGVSAGEPRYTVAAVARRLGVAPATLRTWDRRYGLGPSAHAFGQHRRFTEADVGKLQAMRRLTLQGVPPAEAARMVGDGTAASNDAEPLQPRQSGGGRVVALPGATPDVRGLAR